MKMNVNFHIFQQAFYDCNRGDNFSYEGLQALFNYLEELEESTGEETELDVIALCCEFQEIEDDEEAYREYVGDEAHLEECLIAVLPCSVLVCGG